ncbi:MAG: 3-dehydroquinate dehydratase [Coriobacteriales bacterium]|jgi:3-dehydroquinate dehydratase-2|nr:3-dehydroquinate dehydratase [Coriobacteriales bacterium]
MKILILNGPNLNLLGQREPEIYGTTSLDDLNRRLAQYGESLNQARAEHARVELYFYQSNHEGVLIDMIQKAPDTYAGILYNPAAHSHYSIALRDAVAAIPTPVVEVHYSDIAVREGFRRVSLMEDVTVAQFKGKGVVSYEEGLAYLINYIDEH